MAPDPPQPVMEVGFSGVVSFGPSDDVVPGDVARFCCLADSDVQDESINFLEANHSTIVGFAGTQWLKKLHITQYWTNVNQWHMQLRVPVGFWGANGITPTLADPLFIRVGMSCYTIEQPVWHAYPVMGMYTGGDCNPVHRYFGPTMIYQTIPDATSLSAVGCFQQSYYPQYGIPLTYQGLSQDLTVYGDNGCMIDIHFPFGELFSVFPVGIEHHSRQITIDRLLA